MSDILKISCDIGTTDPTIPLGVEVWVDDCKFVDLTCVQIEPLSIEVPETDGDHELRFVMKNKRPEHTQVDVNGNIVKDAVLTISNVMFNDIALENVFTELTEYVHDFNGTQDTVHDKFYGSMGCNGTVSLKFTAPIYVWLLENM